MIQNEDLSDIPADRRAEPWLERLITLFQRQAQTIQKQAEQITDLKRTVQELRDELNRLKKLPKRPIFRPGGGPFDPKKSASQGPSTPVQRTERQKTKEEVLVKVADVPSGARFKGYQTYSIQELMITPKDVTYKLEVWQAPDGTVIRASLPSAIAGSHFGPSLRALVHNLYANGMTQPAIFDFMLGVGIDVSEGQIHNILVSESEQYQKQGEAMACQESAFFGSFFTA
jgi:hypothetical protein